MATSTNLNIPLLTDSQQQKAVATNAALAAMEKAITATYTLVTTAAVSAGINLSLPYNPGSDLSDRSGLHNLRVVLAAGATAPFNVLHPQNKHLFIVENQTTQVATIKSTGSGTTLNVPAGATYLCYCDGLIITRVNFTPTSIKMPYDLNFSFWGKPATSQLMGRILVSREIVIPANMSGSIGKVGANPITSRTFTVYDDATVIGTVVVNSSGFYTFATTSGSAKTVFAGSALTLVNQSGAADANMTDIEIVIQATLDMPQ